MNDKFDELHVYVDQLRNTYEDENIDGMVATQVGMVQLLTDIITEKRTASIADLEAQLARLVAAKPKRPRKHREKALPKYRNPEDPSQEWTGVGRPPAWAAGKSAEWLLENEIQ